MTTKTEIKEILSQLGLDKGAPLGEAPAGVTIKAFTEKGYDILFTLRDVDELVLLERMAKFFEVLDEKYHLSPTRNGKPVSQTAPLPPVAGNGGHPEDWCGIHSVEMTKYTKEGRSWFSHKADDDTWCKGK